MNIYVCMRHFEEGIFNLLLLHIPVLSLSPSPDYYYYFSFHAAYRVKNNTSCNHDVMICIYIMTFDNIYIFGV